MKYDPGDLRVRKSTVGTTPSDSHVADASKPKRSRTELYAGLGALVLVIVFALIGYGIWTALQNGLEEVTDMGPWPTADVSAAEAVDLHLDHLGFTDSGAYRIPENHMPRPYVDDAAISFFSGGEPVVTIGIVKYTDSDAATSALDLLGATSTCSKLVTVSIGNRGKIRCTMSDAQENVYRNGLWLVDIIAFDTSSRSPSELAELVRDSLSEHWQKIRASTELHARSIQAESNSSLVLLSG